MYTDYYKPLEALVVPLLRLASGMVLFHLLYPITFILF